MTMTHRARWHYAALVTTIATTFCLTATATAGPRYKKARFYAGLLKSYLLTKQHDEFKWFNEIRLADPDHAYGRLLLGALPIHSKVDQNRTVFKQLQSEEVSYVMSMVEPFELNGERKYLRPVTPDEWHGIGVTQELFHAPDHEAMSIHTLEKATRKLDELLRAGQTVYLHCKSGQGRSVMTAMGFFMRYYHWSAEEAEQFIRNERPQIKPNQKQRAKIQEFWRDVLLPENRSLESS